MDDALAHKRLVEVLELIDRFGDLYDRRWGFGGKTESPAALEAEFGVEFWLVSDGESNWLINQPLEGGVDVLVGCPVRGSAAGCG
jgi:hypothetical protein